MNCVGVLKNIYWRTVNMEENKLDTLDEMIGKIYSDVVETYEEYYFKITEG